MPAVGETVVCRFGVSRAAAELLFDRGPLGYIGAIATVEAGTAGPLVD